MRLPLIYDKDEYRVGKKPRHSYRAYLVRCWQEAMSSKKSRWRFSVDEILHKRFRRGFDDLEAFIAFMRAELIGGEDDIERGAHR